MTTTIGELESIVAELDQLRHERAQELRRLTVAADDSGLSPENNQRIQAANAAKREAERDYAAALRELRQRQRRDATVRQLQAAAAVRLGPPPACRRD